ncbi:MAG: hypothetical protein IKX30_14590 [Victivallales bacterium]|nr:hypothetical protein [Victivallales bacterium]
MGCRFFPLEFSILKGVDLAKALKEGHAGAYIIGHAGAYIIGHAGA